MDTDFQRRVWQSISTREVCTPERMQCMCEDVCSERFTAAWEIFPLWSMNGWNDMKLLK